ncbi:DNA mismatch repair protein MutS [Dirofilaria immitis]
MLRDLFYYLFPNVTVPHLIFNIQNLRQQIVSAEVRLIILKETNLEEKYFITAQIIALEAELNQQFFSLLVITRDDEVYQHRTWLEKQNTTYGPLYARIFKRWQLEQNCGPSLLNLSYLQHQSPIPSCQKYPLPRGINPFDDSQSTIETGYRFSDGCAVRNFNMPYPYNNLSEQTIDILPLASLTDFMDSTPLTAPQFLDFSVNYDLTLQLSHFERMLSRNESIETTLIVVPELMRLTDCRDDIPTNSSINRYNISDKFWP